MEILLKKDVEGLGAAGQIKKVKAGYARNFLIPRGLAMPATKGLRKQAAQIKAAAERRQQREYAVAMGLAERINQVVLHFTARAGESGRLYGSVTSATIAEALSAQIGEEIDRRRIRLEHSLRELGEHAITIHLGPNVDAIFKVMVEAEGELEPEAMSEKELEVAAAEQAQQAAEPEAEAEEPAQPSEPATSATAS